MRRPAEAATGVGGMGLLIAVLLGVTDPQTVAVIGAAVSLIPAAVTTLVSGGGVRGVLSAIWRGRKDEPTPVEPEPPAAV